jgi:malic enzyme
MENVALALHKKLHGKLEVVSKGKLKTRDDWSMMYTPGVGAVSSHLAKNPKDAREYTIKRNTVAVISDGSAVLRTWKYWSHCGTSRNGRKVCNFKKRWRGSMVSL